MTYFLVYASDSYAEARRGWVGGVGGGGGGGGGAKGGQRPGDSYGSERGAGAGPKPRRRKISSETS